MLCLASAGPNAQTLPMPPPHGSISVLREALGGLERRVEVNKFKIQSLNSRSPIVSRLYGTDLSFSIVYLLLECRLACLVFSKAKSQVANRFIALFASLY